MGIQSWLKSTSQRNESVAGSSTIKHKMTRLVTREGPAIPSRTNPSRNAAQSSAAHREEDAGRSTPKLSSRIAALQNRNQDPSHLPVRNLAMAEGSPDVKGSKIGPPPPPPPVRKNRLSWGPRPTQPVLDPPAHHLRETKHHHHHPPSQHQVSKSASHSSCGDHHHRGAPPPPASPPLPKARPGNMIIRRSTMTPGGKTEMARLPFQPPVVPSVHNMQRGPAAPGPFASN